MKTIVTNKSDNCLIGIGELIGYWDNGYPIIRDGNKNENAYPLNFIVLYEIEEVPESVELHKYCYTEKDGFYENPDWIDPEIAITQTPEYQAGYDQAVLDLMGEV